MKYVCTNIYFLLFCLQLFMHFHLLFAHHISMTKINHDFLYHKLVSKIILWFPHRLNSVKSWSEAKKKTFYGSPFVHRIDKSTGQKLGLLFSWENLAFFCHSTSLVVISIGHLNKSKTGEKITELLWRYSEENQEIKTNKMFCWWSKKLRCFDRLVVSGFSFRL